MKYEITITPKEKDDTDVTLSLDTTGSFEIKSYGTTMGFSEFIEFSDAINELRQKVEVLMSKEESNGRQD